MSAATRRPATRTAAKKKSTSRRRQSSTPALRVRQSDAAVDSPLPRGLTIVGVGASAGGLEAFSKLLEAIPPDAGLVLILLQHLAPNHESALPLLLSTHTAMPVVQVTDGVRMRANHIYVAPPNAQMEMIGD